MTRGLGTTARDSDPSKETPDDGDGDGGLKLLAAILVLDGEVDADGLRALLQSGVARQCALVGVQRNALGKGIGGGVQESG